MNNPTKVVLVTGASSGLGLATAEYLCKQGYKVYAGARSFKTEEPKKTSQGDQGALYRVNLDVTDAESVDRFVQEVIRKEGRIDVLVNCAAILLLGSVEDISMEEFQKVVDTDLFGTFRMCRQVLPYMRERKKGLIINFSSGAGLVGLPFQSPYSSSKFAIEGFSEVLRWEVKNKGIDVVLVEPGDSKSGSQTTRLRAQKSSSEASAYLADFKTVTDKFAHDEANGAEPIVVARTVHKIITKSKPAIRYNTYRGPEKLLLLKMVLPTWMVEMIFFGYYNLTKSKNR